MERSPGAPWQTDTLTGVRVLLVNEGGQGVVVQGHRLVGTRIAEAVGSSPGVELRVAELAPMSGLVSLTTHEIPAARRWDLDLQPLRWQLVQAARARRIIRHEISTWGPDILYVNTHSLAIASLDEMRRVPTVLSADASMWAWRAMSPTRPIMPYSVAAQAPSLMLERRALAAAAVVQAWSEWAGRALRDACPGAVISVIHPGIDIARYRPAPRNAREHPRVLFIGGRFADKGGPLLLDALRPWLGHTVSIDVVTTAALPAHPGVRVHRLKSEDARLLDLLQQADVLCLPTLQDASPWAVLEAMACGTPVVATDLAGIPEMVGPTGIVVPPGDGRSLALALDAVLNDADRRHELGIAARSRCVQHFDASRQAAALADVLLAAARRDKSSARNGGRRGEVR